MNGMKQTETTLATYGKLRLVRLSPSGCHIITDGSADSIDLHHTEVDAIIADPSLMANADLERRDQDWRETMTTQTEMLCLDERCESCELDPQLRTCERCGAQGMVVDCGHQSQPRPIAADGHHIYCDDCSDAASLTEEQKRFCARAALEAFAHSAAQAHQDEFPGEPISGDWDSKAWAIDQAKCREEVTLLGDTAWEVYSAALLAEVDRLRGGGRPRGY